MTNNKDKEDEHHHGAVEEVNDKENGLHVQVRRGYQAPKAQYWWDTICSKASWYRVKYKSGRFGKECETPCWTTFYGGRSEYTPYETVPDWLQPLVEEVSRDLKMTTPFNAMLLRLYFDGNDEIAWHTDGRTFLGATPTIASLSFGCKATFQMRRMTNVWPPLDGSAGDCIDRSTLQRDFVVGDGDLLVMMGATQKYWHHRVPKERGRRPRLNINFRYIKSGADAERGQRTYYKYMVHGDEDTPKSYSYKEIMMMRGGMMNFAIPKGRQCVPEATGNCKDKDSAFIGNDKRNNSAPLKSLRTCADDTIFSYLVAESIDERTFMALPEDIRKELVSDWKSRQRPPVVECSAVLNAKRKEKRQEIGAVHRYKQKKLTLDAFFSSTTDAHETFKK